MVTLNRLDLLGLLFGLGWTITVNIIGQIYLAELLAITLLFTLNPGKKITRSAVARGILSGYVLLLIALFMSDVRNGTQLTDALRGWANPIFAIINILFVAALLRKRIETLLPIIAGIAIGNLLYHGAPSVNEFMNNAIIMKSQVVPIFTPLTLILATRLARYSNSLSSLIFLLIGLFYIAFGARSAGLIFTLSGIVIFLSANSARFSWTGILVSSIVFPTIFYFGFVFYVDYILNHGGGGNSSWQIGLMDNAYNPIEWIIYGRTDFVVALRAVADNPWFGHGSWARDVGGVYSQLSAAIMNIDRVTYSDFIRGHSVILTAMVWGGVLALAGVVLTSFNILFGIRTLLAARSPFRPIAWYLVIELIWNLFFSPFGLIRTNFFLVAALAVTAPQLLGSATPKSFAPILQGEAKIKS